MRSILEQAVIHHLNGDSEKAQELFHQFIVSRARQIHESMRNGEDPLAEGLDDQITTEEYFTESDLDELEDLEDDNLDGGDEHAAADDFDAAASDDEAAADDDQAAADDLGGDLGLGDEDELAGDEHAADEPAEVEELEARVEDLEAELERLVAKFDAGEGDLEDEGVADDLDDDMAGDPAAPADMHDEDEPFEGLGESTASELEKVSANNTPETEVGAGGKISANEKSGLTQKNATARQGGSPIQVKSKNHKGFEREAAPAVASMKARKNNRATAETGNSAVPAPSNTDGTEVGAGGKISQNTKSPVVPAKGVQK